MNSSDVMQRTGDREVGRKRKNQREERDITASVVAPTDAAALESTQISKYHTKGGHGFAVEDANTIADRFSGKNAEVIGGSNEHRGPDRIVGDVFVQTKYYKTASETMRSAFDPHGGSYRYDGQVLEVPKDQYDECVKLMEQRIREGRVPGHTDPADAKELVSAGSYIYQQARNIARAGNIDSVTFDLTTGAVTASCTFGLSFMINYAQGLWRDLDHTDAFKTALQEALATGLKTLVVHVASAQLLRTNAAALGTVATRQGVRTIARTAPGRKCIEAIASASLGKVVHGAPAVNHVSKLLRSSAVTGTVMVIVDCGPDFYRAAFDGSISWQQFTKNLVVSSAGVGGGIGGWMAGASVGAKVGTAIAPGLGTAIGAVGGAVGAIGGGAISGQAAKSITDEIVEDDAIKLMQALEAELQTLSYEYALSEQEVEKVLYLVRDEVDAEWLRGMYKETDGDAASCRDFIRDQLEHQFMKIAERRLPIYEAAVKAQFFMDQLEVSYEHDNDRFLEALRGLNELCGKVLPWESFGEFDEFMLDDSRTLKL